MNQNISNREEAKFPGEPTESAGQGQVQKNWNWLLILCLALGALMAALLYKQQMGLQWLIFVLLFELSLFVFAFIRKTRVPLTSVLLALINIAIAMVTVFRTEPYSTALAVVSNLLGVGLLAATFLNGQWLLYRLREYFIEAIRLMLSVMAGFFRLFFKEETPLGLEANAEDGQGWKKVKPYLIGVLIATPLLLLFGSLFSSADPVFAEKIQALFAWIRIENLADLIQPLILGTFIAYISFGAIAFAFTRGAQSQALSSDRPLFKAFLGTTESMVVLVLLNLLFASFLFVQVRYFFGGGQNIAINGYTYSEYARKGFFELLAVALFAGGLHWGLNAVTNRAEPGQKLAFALAVTLLYLQVGVVMVSAFQRMRLYIQAYGLTQERLLPQIFMVVVACILLTLLIMEWRNRFNRLAMVLTLSLFSFTLVVAGFNVDRYIASENLDLAVASGKLDASFAVDQLSTDAIPLLFKAYDNKMLPADIRQTLGKILACKAARLGRRLDLSHPWFATNPVNQKAKSLFDAHRLELAQYTFETREEGSGIEFADGFVFCDYSYNSD